MMRVLLIIGICTMSLSTLTVVSAQKADVQDKTHPKVFLIGEQPEVFEALNEDYPKLLLDICGKDMKLAYGKWIDMLQAMEQHAGKMSFDIRGVKMWMKVFWDKKGNIQHIAYHLMPDSKNVRSKILSAFFRDFMKHYQTPCETDDNFSQYSTASFPTFAQRVKRSK